MGIWLLSSKYFVYRPRFRAVGRLALNEKHKLERINMSNRSYGGTRHFRQHFGKLGFFRQEIRNKGGGGGNGGIPIPSNVFSTLIHTPGSCRDTKLSEKPTKIIVSSSK